MNSRPLELLDSAVYFFNHPPTIIGLPLAAGVRHAGSLPIGDNGVICHAVLHLVHGSLLRARKVMVLFLVEVAVVGWDFSDAIRADGGHGFGFVRLVICNNGIVGRSVNHLVNLKSVAG